MATSKTKLFVFKEQSIGCVSGNWYEAITGLANKGWGGPHTAPTTFTPDQIRPAQEEDLKIFKLSNAGDHYEVAPNTAV